MTRLARNQSSTNIYHIILRGNNKQQIFLDDEDYTRFLNIVSGYKERYDFMLLAYCLMGNHIHLLIKTDETPLSTIMKSIVVKFVYYYNVKYQRVGHLFQDRFKSEPVESEPYLLQVVRYIHKNPIKAGICSNYADYKFSSYNEYFNKSVYADTVFLLNTVSLNNFKAFHEENVDDKVMDITENKIRVSDNAAMEIITKIYKKNAITSLPEMPRDIQIGIAAELRKKGLSVRQISRLTGISKKIAERSK